MSVHDTYARVTPMELSFPNVEAAAERFRAVAEEARARGSDTSDPTTFVLLMEVGRAMRELRIPEGDGSAPEHGALLYHLYHCWRAGNPLYTVDTGLTRLLVESRDWESGRPTPPVTSAYVQFPQHLLWVRPYAEAAPESVDGLFWTVSDERVSFLVAMGIRSDRPGFSVAPLEPMPLELVPEWVGARMREEGEDFESTLPGAELDRLYELRTAGEVLKLGGRLLLYLERASEGAPRDVDAKEGKAPPGSGGPPPSALAYTRLALST